MSAVSRSERLRPPLMHAFRKAHASRDARGGSQTGDADHRRPASTTFTEHALREQVGLNIEALMNTANLASSLPLGAFHEVERSILNYGLPDIVHRFASESSIGDIRDDIRMALEIYEPRLVAQTIRVTLDEGESGRLSVRFRVQADLICEPVEVPVEFIADLELDTGAVSVKRR